MLAVLLVTSTVGMAQQQLCSVTATADGGTTDQGTVIKIGNIWYFQQTTLVSFTCATGGSACGICLNTRAYGSVGGAFPVWNLIPGVCYYVSWNQGTCGAQNRVKCVDTWPLSSFNANPQWSSVKLSYGIESPGPNGCDACNSFGYSEYKTGVFCPVVPSGN